MTGKKGFSLVELIIVTGILTIIFSIIFAVFLTTEKLWKGGFTQIAFQSRGRIVLERIGFAVRSSTMATVLDAGDKIRLESDPNRTPETSSDDVTSEYYISGVSLVYDPDISVSGDEIVLARKVYKESDIPFFQISGNLAVITFKLYNTDAVYGTHWSSMTTSVKIRNV
jgi:prepilin-type N-terminal cleavage/methylation domain-containing protein